MMCRKSEQKQIVHGISSTDYLTSVNDDPLMIEMKAVLSVGVSDISVKSGMGWSREEWWYC